MALRYRNRRRRWCWTNINELLGNGGDGGAAARLLQSFYGQLCSRHQHVRPSRLQPRTYKPAPRSTSSRHQCHGFRGGPRPAQSGRGWQVRMDVAMLQRFRQNTLGNTVCRPGRALVAPALLPRCAGQRGLLHQNSKTGSYVRGGAWRCVVRSVLLHSKQVCYLSIHELGRFLLLSCCLPLSARLASLTSPALTWRCLQITRPRLGDALGSTLRPASGRNFGFQAGKFFGQRQAPLSNWQVAKCSVIPHWLKSLWDSSVAPPLV